MGGVRRLAARAAAADLGAYAAALAYNFMFALFPLLLFLSAAVGFLHLRAQPLIFAGPLADLVPANVLALVRGALQVALRQRSGAAFGLGLTGFVAGMSGAVRQIMDALNHTFPVAGGPRRGTVRLYVESTLLGVGIGVLLVVGVVLAVAGRALALLLVPAGFPQSAVWVAQGMRWFITLALLLVVLDVAYAYGPDVHRPFRWVSWGSAAALVSWVLLSVGFSLYTAHFNHYNAVYGTLGGIILLLLYLYLCGLALLLGAVINAVFQD